MDRSLASFSLYKALLFLAALQGVQACDPVTVSPKVPQGAGKIIGSSFVSYAIEFSNLPDFAGNKSQPNDFSSNLLSNLGKIQDGMPILRIGGNTQDQAIYDAKSKDAVHTKDDSIVIGPSFYESFSTFKNTKFIYGFNLGSTGDAADDSLPESVDQACKALGDGKVAFWEYGNEPDLYNANHKRKGYNETTYAQEWQKGTKKIHDRLQKCNKDLVSADNYGYIAPSISGANFNKNSFSAATAFDKGLNNGTIIKQISAHNYIDGAKNAGVTLQGTLMNHTRTMSSLDNHVRLMHDLDHLNLDYILGEYNSLYNGGKDGLSNVLGAGLWTVDFGLFAAANNITRLHMQQATYAPYHAWLPTGKTPMTKAPYYGNIMVATMIGKNRNSTQIAHLPIMDKDTPSQADDYAAAYAAYEDGKIKRLAVINLHAWSVKDKRDRPTSTYKFKMSNKAGAPKAGTKLPIARLSGPGSDSLTGIQFNSTTYDFTPKQGQPVEVTNNNQVKNVQVQKDGTLEVEIPYSEAWIISFP